MDFRTVRISPIKKGSLEAKAAAPQEEDEGVVFSTFLQVSMSLFLFFYPAAPANIVSRTRKHIHDATVRSG